MSKWSVAERVDGMNWRWRSNGGERGIGEATHDLFEQHLRRDRHRNYHFGTKVCKPKKALRQAQGIRRDLNRQIISYQR